MLFYASSYKTKIKQNPTTLLSYHKLSPRGWSVEEHAWIIRALKKHFEQKQKLSNNLNDRFFLSMKLSIKRGKN